MSHLRKLLPALAAAGALTALLAPAATADPVTDVVDELTGNPAAHAAAASGSDVVILGARLDDNCAPPAVLDQRLDRAADFLRVHPANRVLVTGGHTSACPLSEAQVMEAGLRVRLVPNPIIRDDAAGSTVGNAAAAAALGVTNAVLVTSADHLPRATGDFEAAGVTVTGVAA